MGNAALDALKKRLAANQKVLQSGGRFVKFGKDFTAITMRLLPFTEETPQLLAVSTIWLPGLKKMLTSPRTFGVPDPVLDALDQMPPEQRKRLTSQQGGVIMPSRGAMVGVIDRGNPGDASNPVIKFATMPGTVYDFIKMKIQDDGDDILDPDTGKDVRVRRIVENNKASYVTECLGPSALGCPSPAKGEDKAYRKAVLAAWSKISLLAQLTPISVEDMDAAMRLITGGPIPDEYLEALAELVAKQGEDSGDKPKTKVKSTKPAKAVVKDEDEDEDEDDDDKDEDEDDDADDEDDDADDEDDDDDKDEDEDDDDDADADDDDDKADDDADDEDDDKDEDDDDDDKADDDAAKVKVGDVLNYVGDGGKKRTGKVIKIAVDDDGDKYFRVELETGKKDVIYTTAMEWSLAKGKPDKAEKGKVTKPGAEKGKADKPKGGKAAGRLDSILRGNRK